MKEKIYLEKKDGKIFAHFAGKWRKNITKESDILKVKKDLEEQGYIVELKE